MVPAARQVVAPVLEQQQLATDTWRLRIAAPELARIATPGQFFMIREPGTTQPLLGRPFALYDTVFAADGTPIGIDVVYLVVGTMTQTMRTWRPGDLAEVWGPLGNGFPVPDHKRLLCVAGGIGNTPFLATIREALGLRTYGQPARNIAQPAESVRFCYGARTASYLAGLGDFAAIGVNVDVATDDGSRGHHGYVTDLLRRQLAIPAERPTAVYCCGPEPMMHAVARLCDAASVPCWLSLETPMACGFGACFSCVTRVKQPDGGWDYRRVCVEGPIFPSRELFLE